MAAMGKTWVLDTGTKGTGASVVPLERERPRPAAAPERIFVPPKPRPPAPEPPAPRVPRRFKVVDVMTRETLAEDVDARATVELLGDVHSIVDVRISVWDRDAGRWRLLTLDEQRAIWDARHR
jgi:hypothetical protein